MPHNDSQSQSVAVCVLGMHRSGTSALTRLINLLGVYVGEDLIPGSIDNPKGFWEDRAIVAVHEELLDALGSAFDDVLPLPAGWELSPKVKPFRNQLVKIIRQQFIKDGKLWGFKDPRVCRLLPMWRSIFETVRTDARYILVIRNPEEIARSLAVRDGYSLNKSLLLTLTHLLEAAVGTRGQSRVVVSYKSLMEDWQGVAKKIADVLGVTWPQSSEKIAPDVAAFLDTNLRHHAVATPLLSSSALTSADPNILRWIAQLHEMFLAAEDDPGRIDSDLVDKIRGEFEAERPRLDAWKAQRSLGRQNVILEQWGKNLDRARRKMREENNWLKLALARLGLDPPQVVAAIKAEASVYPNSAALPADLAAASGNIAEMKSELQRRQETIERLNSELANLQAWTAELDQARTWLVREQAAIKQEVDLRDQHIQEIQNWVQELDSGRRWQAGEIEALKTELARRDEQIRQMQQGLSNQETGKNWLASQCEHFKTENERLLKWIEEQDGGRRWLASERDYFKTENERLLKWIEEQEGGRHWLASERDHFKSEYERLRKWTEELDSGRHWQADQIDALKTELARREERIGLLQQEFKEQETGKNWLAGEYDYFRAEYERLRKWVEELESGRRWLESERGKLSAFLAQVQAGAGDGQSQIQKMMSQVLERDATIRNLEAWTRELDQSRRWFSEQIAGAQGEIDNRDKTISELKAWVAELEQAKAWLVEQRESLQAELQRRDEEAAEKSESDSISPEPGTFRS